MKHSLLFILICLLHGDGFAQNSAFVLPTRQTPVTKKEKLSTVNYITDLSPALWSSMTLSSNDRYFLTNRRISQGPEPANYVYPQQKYKEIIDYVWVEITATCSGKKMVAESSSDKLTAEQKTILNSADLGTNIDVKIKYKYKNQKPDDLGPRTGIAQGNVAVTVLPESEAEFPGGLKQLSKYLESNFASKVSQKDLEEKVFRAEVRFTIDEAGQVLNARVSQTTTDNKLDKMLLQTLTQMPKWKPAENSKGEKVKQEVIIPFNVGC